MFVSGLTKERPSASLLFVTCLLFVSVIAGPELVNPGNSLVTSGLLIPSPRTAPHRTDSALFRQTRLHLAKLSVRGRF
jgi:hypothetical protein